MATPASGAISMNDMRTEINRATSSSISMSEMRARYGGSGAISFSDLRNCEGFQMIPAAYTDKYSNYNGYYPATGTGSVSPDEADSGTLWSIRFAANSYLSGLTGGGFGGTTGTLSLTSNAGYSDVGFTAGYAGTDVTRIVIANTSTTITGSGNNFTTFDGYSIPSSGTLHCLIKF